MTRASFGGGVADFVVTAAAPGDPLRFAAATLTMWDAETGGTQWDDLLLDTVPVTSIPVSSDGQVPSFEGPDGVMSMWAQAGSGGGGRARLDAVGSILGAAAGVTDGLMQTVDNDPGSSFRVQQDARLLTSIADGQGGGAGSLAPFFVSTMELAGSINAAPGARTGLATTQYTVTAGDGTTASQGYVNENIATGVSGALGAYTLTVTDTAMLATLDGAGTGSWDAVVVNGDGRAYPVTVLDVSGGTVTTLRPLPVAITGGQLSSRTDAVGGQHLTKAGYKMLAQHAATFSPLVATRGGITEGQWDTTPPDYRTIWAKNAALTAYGVSNSAAPIVQSSLLTPAAAPS